MGRLVRGGVIAAAPAARAARGAGSAARARRVRRAVRAAGRAGRVRRRLHDGLRQHRVPARPPGRRPAHRDRDDRQRRTDRGRGRRPGARRRGHRLRQRDQRGAHRGGLRAGRGGRAPPRGPGVAQEVRAHERQGGDRRRGDGGQDPRPRSPPGATRTCCSSPAPTRPRSRAWTRRSNGPAATPPPGPTRCSSRRRRARRTSPGSPASCAVWLRWCSTGPRAAARRRCRWPASPSWGSRW